jgi:beta-N-acetylhexosaminidase
VWRILNLALGVLRFAVALLLLWFAWQWRSPLFASIRPLAFAIFILVPVALAVLEIIVWRSGARWRSKTVVCAATLLVAVLALATTLATDLHFRWMRTEVLRADPAQLERLGRHFIVGYRGEAEHRDLIDLIERRAIAGIFVTAHNVRGKDADTVRRDIDALQAIRKRQGLPPLLVATDQEGGGVSRMSPPLPRPTTLGDVVRSHSDPAARREAVRGYAAEVGRSLAGLGINLNFAPVIDLDHGVTNPNDRYSRITTRAISSDPHVVAEVARDYCEGLRHYGVHCTLKHFPGLGRVFEDTHFEHASLSASVDQLAQSDWVPFRALMREPGMFTMLGHARLAAIDGERPVSFSAPVVSGLLRGQWKYDGVLVTDDFSMAAAYETKGGLAGAGVSALNAGVDLILTSYDPDQYFPMLHALLRAEASGRLKKEALEQSDRRLAGVARAASPPTAIGRSTCHLAGNSC